MKVKSTMEIFQGRKFARAIMTAAGRATKATAKAAIIDQTQRIPMGITPQGESQRPNKPSTIKRKQAKYGHSISLRGAENILSNPSSYRIEKKGSKLNVEYAVHLPAARITTLVHLRQKGYRYWEISPEIKEFYSDAMTAEFNGLAARLDSFVK